MDSFFVLLFHTYATAQKKTTQVEISGSVLVDVNDQEAISKIENGQSGNGNGEWERGRKRGTGNENGEYTKRGNL